MLTPVKYSIGLDENHIYIEKRSDNAWALTALGMCMDRDGDFEYEPSPSNRSEDYIKTHRFDSPEEALAVFKEKSKLVINGKKIQYKG